MGVHLWVACLLWVADEARRPASDPVIAGDGMVLPENGEAAAMTISTVDYINETSAKMGG